MNFYKEQQKCQLNNLEKIKDLDRNNGKNVLSIDLNKQKKENRIQKYFYFTEFNKKFVNDEDINYFLKVIQIFFT